MTEILLLEEIINKVMQNPDKEFCLFGKENYDFGDIGKYDFIFDFIQKIPLEKLKDAPYLIIPVFLDKPGSDQSILRMNETNKVNPLIQTFAFKDNKPRIHTQFGKKQEKYGTFLEFYDLNELDYGIEVLNKKSYLTVSKEMLKKNLPNWKEIFENISKQKQDITKRYRNH